MSIGVRCECGSDCVVAEQSGGKPAACDRCGRPLDPSGSTPDRDVLDSQSTVVSSPPEPAIILPVAIGLHLTLQVSAIQTFGRVCTLGLMDWFYRAMKYTVVLDGTLVTEGDMVDGFDASCQSTVGRHRLEITSLSPGMGNHARRKPFDLDFFDPGNYEIRLYPNHLFFQLSHLTTLRLPD